MDKFITKRPRTPTDDDAGAKKSNKLPASTAKPTKPKEHEFVGAGAIQRLDASTLTVALDALEKVDEHCKTLVTTARSTLSGGANHLLVEPPAQHAHFIFLCEFVVRRRIAVKSADTILHNLKDKVGSSWTPQTVMSHEPVLREYMKVGEGASGKVDTILELARLFASTSAPDLDAMTDSQVVACKALTDIKGIGATTLRTLLVRMGRPNVFVSGDGLVRKWMQKCYGIDPNKETAETERARIEKASEWAPYRSVIYLLIAYAKDPITSACILG